MFSYDLLDEVGTVSGKIKSVLYSKFPALRHNLIDDNTDLDLIRRIQPVGGVNVNHENYITLGDGYMTCIQVNAVPEQISRHWLYSLYKLDNVMVTVDTKPMKNTEVKDKIKKSVNEHISRESNAKDVVEVIESETQVNKLTRLLMELEQLGNVVLEVIIKIYVVGRTFYEMEQNVIAVEQSIKENGFSKYCRNINEQGIDYQSLFLPMSEVKKTLGARRGLPFPANYLASALPYYYIGWQDPNGYYLGNTYFEGGQGTMFFDPFYIDDYRTCYDGFICGAKGTGKSTTLKTLIEQTVATGNKARVIDVDGGFVNLVQNLGGVVVRLDGCNGEGILNPLEILRMDEDDTINYLMHISKMSLMYRLKSPSCDDMDVDLYTSLLKKLYVQFGIIPSEETSRYSNITGLDSKRYPIFSDLLAMIKGEIKEIINKSKQTEEDRIRIRQLKRVESVVESIVKNFGSLFDGHTNIPSIFDADVISFDISAVSDMDPTAYDMQLFNVLSMAYDSCMSVGAKMKYLYDNGKISLEDVVHHLIIIDESHKSINSGKPFAVQRMLDIMRQDRKYFIGVWLATQDISDMCESGDSKVNKDMNKLFGLCQYKMIFRQDSSSLDIIGEAFKNVLSNVQIESIPNLRKREMLLVLSSVHTIRVTNRNVSQSKLATYGGGA